MALSHEDKKDVKTHLGKALANKVSKVTRDGIRKPATKEEVESGKKFANGYPRGSFIGDKKYRNK